MDCPCGAIRIDAQLGLEKTPEAYVANLVAVFFEVRRVLRDDGTLWLNLGDSYWGGKGQSGHANPDYQAARIEAGESFSRVAAHVGGHGLTRPQDRTHEIIKPKDLVGIPWRMAFALQQPYYTGRIKNEADRIWLAAMIDGEGCMFIHKRKAGQHNGQGYYRKNASFGAGLEVANCSEAIVRRCLEIAGIGSICTQSPNQNHRRKQPIYRWNARINECRDIIREVYPYLVAKQHQARILLGCPSSGPEAEAAHVALMGLHNGIETDIDFPAPSPMTEPGFYLRSDIIWAKKNCMPESVKDRPTRSHEYIFLMSKNARYYYDAEAIAEEAAWERWGNQTCVKDYRGIKPVDTDSLEERRKKGKNRRSVWTVATQPYTDAHFATFPPDLIEPCVKAGCPVGGIVLDPFFGAGTTGLVAMRLGREFIGIELNQKYCDMAKKRIYGELVSE